MSPHLSFSSWHDALTLCTMWNTDKAKGRDVRCHRGVAVYWYNIWFFLKRYWRPQDQAVCYRQCVIRSWNCLTVSETENLHFSANMHTSKAPLTFKGPISKQSKLICKLWKVCERLLCTKGILLLVTWSVQYIVWLPDLLLGLSI